MARGDDLSGLYGERRRRPPGAWNLNAETVVSRKAIAFGETFGGMNDRCGRTAEKAEDSVFIKFIKFIKFSGCLHRGRKRGARRRLEQAC